jgi:hypothetical protein
MDNQYSDAELSEEVDPEFDSVQVMFEKMKYRANGNKKVEGGFEVPANMALGRCYDEDADYTVKIKDRYEGYKLAFDDRLVPPVHKPEPVAKKSDDPFSHPFLDNAPVGLFGKALVAHAKLITILKHNHQPVEKVEMAFRAQWGIDKDADLNEFYPKPRSTGAAMYGGIKRKTVPSVLAVTGSQIQVDIIDHRVGKESVGQEALVNWPRMKAIAMATGVQIAADDKYYRDNVKGKDIEIGYKIARPELMTTPSEIVAPDFPVVKENDSQVTKAAMVQISKQMRKIAAIRSEKYDNLKIADIFPDSIITLVGAEGIGKPYQEDYDSTANMVEGDLDLYGSKRNLPKGHVTATDHKTFEDIRPVDIIRNEAESYFDRNLGNVEDYKSIKKTIVELDGQYVKSMNTLKALISKVIPNDILSRVLRIGDVFKPGLGTIWVNQLKSYLGFRHLAFSTRDFEQAWLQGLTKRKTVERVATEISDGFRNRSLMRIDKPVVTKHIADLLSHKLSVGQGLSMLIERHKIYWKNRYHKASLLTEDYKIKVKKQVAAKVFKKLRFELDESQAFVLDETVVYEVLRDVYSNLLIRRYNKKNIDKKVKLPKPVGKTFLEYSVQLDRALQTEFVKKPKVGFEEIASYLQIEIDKFIGDFQDLLARVLVKKPIDKDDSYVTDTMIQEDIQIKKEVPIKASDGKQEIVANVNRSEQLVVSPVVSNTSFFSDEPKKVSEADWMSALKKEWEESKTQVVDTTIDLVEELIEDNIQIDKPVAKMIIGQYPKRVDVKKYAKIRDRILAATK